MTTPSLKIKTIPKPVIKGKMDVRFPSSVSADLPLTLDKTGGNFRFGFDLANVENQLLDQIISDISGQFLTAIPVPTPTTLGGVKSKAATSHQFLTQIGLDGSVSAAQPAFSDVSGALSTTQTNAANYQQSDTGAVSSPLINRFSNTLFAHEFGAVGDDSTNDYAALQAWLTAVCASGKEGRLDPGKKYYVSGNDLLISSASGTRNLRFIGYGSQIRTNPAEARTGLKIQNTFPFIGRPDETRRTIVEGWFFSQYDDANAAWGIEVVATPNVIIRDCSFANGSDTGVVPYINYAAIRARQSSITVPDTGVFWMTIENCRFKGGANQMRNGLWLEGAINATSITKNSFANVDVAIRYLCANSGGSTANDGYVGNGNRIIDNSFEAILEGIKFNGLAGQSTCDGLIVANNRIESVTTAFFSYGGINTEGFVQPMLGPNYLDSGSWGRYITNTNGLRVDVRDAVIGRATINPGSLAAGATTTIGTVTVAPAATGDQVAIEANGDLQGLLATGYVSAANTVTIRLTNPTSAAVDLPSLKWVARVRPQF